MIAALFVAAGGTLKTHANPSRHARIAVPVALCTGEAVPAQRLRHAAPCLELRTCSAHVEPCDGVEVPPPNRKRLDARQARRERGAQGAGEGFATLSGGSSGAEAGS